MASAAYEHNLVSPFDTIFTNGEKLIGPAATLGGASAGTYNFSRWMNLKGGVYNLKLRGTGAVTLKSGPNKAGLATVVAVAANTTLQTQVYLPPGQIRLDFSLAHSSGNCGAAFLLFEPDEVIYASDGDAWVFEATTVPDDNELVAPVDPRLALPMFTELPNWQNGILERLSYVTDIMTSETAAEQRRAVRVSPRRQFEAQFMRHDARRARLDNFALGVGRSEFMVPLWHEQFRPTGGLASGSSYVDFPADTLWLREFMEDDLVLVTNGDPAVYEVLKVSTINTSTDRLTWVTGPSNDWPAGSRIIPMRKARITDATPFNNPVDRVATVTFRFDLSDPFYRFGPSWGYCSPLWRFKTDWASGVEVRHDRTAYTLDNTSGPVYVTDPGQRAHVGERVSLLLRGRENLAVYRRFIAAACGRGARFYFPSFTRDMVPVQDLDGDTFNVRSMGFTDYVKTPQWARTWIGIVLKDGSPTLYRKITGMVEVDEATEQITVDKDIPPVALSAIAKVQFIVPSRFDQDSFELQHLVDEAAAVRTTVVTRSVDGDGMPDIECWVTSAVYPIEGVDAMSFGVALEGGRLRPAPGAIEDMSLALALTGGSLYEPLETYNGPPEDAMDFAVSLEGGTLGAPLVTTTTDPLALDMGVELTNGGLRTVMLTYTESPEGMDFSVDLTGGSLT